MVNGARCQFAVYKTGKRQPNRVANGELLAPYLLRHPSNLHVERCIPQPSLAPHRRTASDAQIPRRLTRPQHPLHLLHHIPHRKRRIPPPAHEAQLARLQPPLRLAGARGPPFGHEEVAAAGEVVDEGAAGVVGHGAGVEVGVADSGPGVVYEGGGGAAGIDGEVEGVGRRVIVVGRREGEDGCWERQQEGSREAHSCALNGFPGFAIEGDRCEKLGFGLRVLHGVSILTCESLWDGGGNHPVSPLIKVHSLLLSSRPVSRSADNRCSLSVSLSMSQLMHVRLSERRCLGAA